MAMVTATSRALTPAALRPASPRAAMASPQGDMPREAVRQTRGAVPARTGPGRPDRPRIGPGPSLTRGAGGP